MARFNLQIFGDESTASDIVTYGIVVFPNVQEARRAQYAWQSVLKTFGGNSTSKIHARELFKFHARQKTDWAHLNVEDAGNLALKLISAVKDYQPIFSLGCVDLASWPKEGIPDGLNQAGEQQYRILEKPVFYGYGFQAAIFQLQAFLGYEIKDRPYELMLDPQSDVVKLFSHWNRMQVSKLFEAGGLKVSKLSHQPQLLDAADLFAYAAARALSIAEAPNKMICQRIYEETCCIRSDFRWPVNPVGK